MRRVGFEYAQAENDVPPELDAIGRDIVTACKHVRKRLGTGLLESTYRQCLAETLRVAGRTVKHEVWQSLEFDGLFVEKAYKLDLLVDDLVVIELKAVESLHAVHHAQLLTYLRLGERGLGFLVNFGASHGRQFIKRYANTRGSENWSALL